MVTKLRHRDTMLPRTRYAVSTAAGNAMPCHHTGYDSHDIHIIWIRETKANNQRENNNIEDKLIQREKY